MMRALIISDPFAPKTSLQLVAQLQQCDIRVEQLAIGSVVNEEFFKWTYYMDLNSQQLINLKQLAQVIGDFIKTQKYDIVCSIASSYMRNLIARISALLKTGLVADVTAINFESSQIELIRPTHQDQKIATICSRNLPLMMSIRNQGNYNYSHKIDDFNLVYIHTSINALSAKQTLTESTIELEDAKLIIAGGNGLGNNFDLLFRLEDYLHGLTAGSKRSVDNGWLAKERQVGMSGKIVKPKIYIAIGIEGYIHHIVGMQQADFIISINKNRTAAINTISDVVIEADGKQFCDQLLMALTALK